MAVNQGDSTVLGAARSIYKAVVVDVLTPGDNISSAFPVTNSEKLAFAPQNSCVVKIYGVSTSPPDAVVAYPFFPPHMSIPVKPGEIVWVVSPTVDEPTVNDCYWVCKIATSNMSDDVNYSHPFRTPVPASSVPDNGLFFRKAAADVGSPQQPISRSPPQFLNGVSQKENIDSALGAKLFDLVYTGSSSHKFLTPEPTPDFLKRPGDLVFQGSNNTVISLGLDRGYSIVDFDNLQAATGSSSLIPALSGSGTIDIVAGRSRYLPPFGNDFYSSTDEEESDTDLTRTAIPTIKNTRGLIERDKNLPALKQGDVDFAVDASRLYVSMQTDGDYNFALLNTLTGSVARMPASIVSGSIQPASGSAYVIAKSDEIRIIARKQLEDEYYPDIGNPEINGSIKIIKEGTKDGDLAAVVLQPDGSIQISGSRIFLGRHPEDGGLEESEAGPEDATHVQPYVRYQQLEDLLNAIMDNIDAFCDTLNTHVTPGYGNPSPQILDAAATLKSDIASRREEIVSLKSERIFGE